MFRSLHNISNAVMIKNALDGRQLGFPILCYCFLSLLFHCNISTSFVQIYLERNLFFRRKQSHSCSTVFLSCTKPDSSHDPPLRQLNPGHVITTSFLYIYFNSFLASSTGIYNLSLSFWFSHYVFVLQRSPVEYNIVYIVSVVQIANLLTYGCNTKSQHWTNFTDSPLYLYRLYSCILWCLLFRSGNVYFKNNFKKSICLLPVIYFCVFQADIFQRVFPIEESYVLRFLYTQATYPNHLIPLYFVIIEQKVICVNDTFPGHVISILFT